MLSRQAIRSVRAAAAAPARTIARVPVRSYAAPAASAASSQEVKPPIAVYGLDGTYATALVRNIPPSNCVRPFVGGWVDVRVREQRTRRGAGGEEGEEKKRREKRKRWKGAHHLTNPSTLHSTRQP